MGTAVNATIQNVVIEAQGFSIPKTRYDLFCVIAKTQGIGHKRWGQAFYDFMEFHKVTSPKFHDWAESLYQETDLQKARQMVLDRLDHMN